MNSLVIINGVIYDTSVCEMCVFGRKGIDCPRLAAVPVLVCSWLDNEDEDGTHFFIEREV